ncbi:hypothetical protein DFH08DRAFT_1084951 [Mycena albidolilacea]|uniref:Uncharacterized protein n=1 Tax=Mycena albidolilacea TaxID=1033008 RepID=A0AAD6ZJW6_9AGAR|nr:hypothetical protein DFH08DRAFT_1084951 [Mycena albidolilacea]
MSSTAAVPALPGRVQFLAYITAAAQDARVSEACLKRSILRAAKGARERDRLVQEFNLREVGRTRTDRRALRELRHQATPPSHLAPLSSLRLLPRSPAALLVPLIPPTPPFVSPPSSVETPHDSERRHLREPSRTRPPPPMSVAPASLQCPLPHPCRSRRRLHSLSFPPTPLPPVRCRLPSTLRPYPRPERKPGRRFRHSDAQANGRRALTDRQSPDGYATPGPPSRPPRRPAVFSAPPLHLLAEKTTTTDSAHPTTTTTNSTTEEPRREDHEPADLGTLSSVARRGTWPTRPVKTRSRGADALSTREASDGQLWLELLSGVKGVLWSVVVVLSVRLPRRPFLGATFAPRLHGPTPTGTRYPARRPQAPHAGKAPRPQAPTPSTHSRPQRTHVRMVPAAPLSPQLQRTDASIPRQVRLGLSHDIIA